MLFLNSGYFPINNINGGVFDLINLTRHTGVPVATYTLMHADEVVAVARRDIGLVEIIGIFMIGF